MGFFAFGQECVDCGNFMLGADPEDPEPLCSDCAKKRRERGEPVPEPKDVIRFDEDDD